MFSFSDTWGMYQDMKAKRRQREQDDINNERYAEQQAQQSLSNANTQRQLNNQDRTYNANEAQRVVTNDAAAAAVDLAANTKARGRAQGQMKSMITGITQGGGDANKWLGQPANMDMANQMVTNSPSLLAQVQNTPGGEKYTIAGIQQLQDAEGNPRYALMINTGQVDADGNPVLKPLSEARGTDDAVMSLGGQGTVDYLEQAILSDLGSTRTQDQNSAMTLGAAALDPNAQPVVQQGGQQAGTTASLANPLPQTLLNEKLSTYTTPAAETVEVGTTTQGSAAAFEAEKLGDAWTFPEESKNGFETAGRIAGAGVDGISSLVSGVGDRYSQWASGIGEAASDIATGFSGSNKPVETKVSAPTPAPIKLTSKQSKGVEAAPGAIKADNGVAQIHLNKGAVAAANKIPTEAEIDEAYTLTTTAQTKVDTSSLAQRQRADALISLKEKGLINMPSAEKVGMFVKTGAMDAPTTQVTTFGDWDEKVTKNGFGQTIKTERTYSSTYKTRMKAYRKANGDAAAKIEEQRVKDVETNWEEASILGAGNAGGGDLKDGEFGTMIGTIPKGEFKDYFRGLLRANDNHVQSVLPKGMDINALTGSNGELGVLAALAKSTASALKEGTFKKGDFTQFTAGDWMQVMKRYPPAASSGLYVYGNKIHSVDVELDAYMKEFNVSEADARSELKAAMSRQQDAATAAENDR